MITIFNTLAHISFTAMLLLASASAVVAGNGDINSYQGSALLQPNSSQTNREATDSDLVSESISQILDSQPKKTKSNKLVNPERNDENNSPTQNFESGEFLQNNDDC